MDNVTDLDHIGMNLNIRNLSTSAEDILLLLPKERIPENIVLPDRLSLQGTVKGNMEKLFTDVHLKTSLGNIDVRGNMSDIQKPKVAAYDVGVSLEGLQLGKLTPQPDTMGAITAQFTIKGTAYDPKEVKANMVGFISSFDYKGYVYKNINLDANLNRMTFMANGDIKEPNIHLSFDAEGDLLAVKPCIIFNATIDSIKTLPLHLTTKPVVYRGKISSYIPAFDVDTLVGTLFITESLIVANNKKISLDSVSMVASFDKNVQSINLYSDFAQASIQGKYKVTQLGDIFIHAMKPYYALRPDTISKKLDAYDFKIDAGIRDHPTIRTFIPALNRMDKITLNGEFSDRDGWNATLLVPYVAYGTNILSDLKINADASGNVLNITADAGKMTSGDNITMTGTRFNADIANQKIDFALRIGDKEKLDKYIIHGGFEKGSNQMYSFTIRPDSLLLNYDRWTMQKNNLIRFGSDAVQVSDFDLSKDDQHLIIQNKESGPNSPVEVLFKDFKLATLTGFFQTDSLLADGTLDGMILLKDITTQPNFTTDLSIKHLTFNRDTIGDVRAVVHNHVPKVFATDVVLSGRGNDVSLTGNYFLRPDQKSTMDFILDIKNLQMKSLEGASMGNIRDSKGHLSGKVNIGGSMTSPDISGNLEFFRQVCCSPSSTVFLK